MLDAISGHRVTRLPAPTPLGVVSSNARLACIDLRVSSESPSADNVDLRPRAEPRGAARVGRFNVPVIEESIVISRPAVEVFEFLTEPENVLLYSSNVVEYEQVSGAPRDVGGVARGTVRVAGRRLSFTTELVEVEPARLARTRSSDASIPFRLELRFDEVPEGTRVTWHQETDELGGFFGKLGDAVVVKVYARDVRSNLANAKTLLEAQ